MKPSSPACSGQSASAKLFRLRLFKYFYICLSCVCIVWLLLEGLNWEPFALMGLSLLGLGALGPEFAKLPPGAVSNLEIGSTASSIPDPTIGQSWLANIWDTVAGAMGVAFGGFMQFLVEGFLYLILGGGIFLFQWVASLF